jgi:AcrR family transcriptional regulator
MTARRKPDARERLLDAADRLFYRCGLHASGIDTVIAEAGVAKMTLYSHFKSKDELIAAYLRRRGERTRAWLATRTEHHAASGDWLAAFFAALKEWFASDEFRGCAFINASAELPQPGHPGRAAIAEHEHAMGAFVTDVLRKAGVPDPTAAVPAILLLVNGAIVSVANGSGPEVADVALSAAKTLLRRDR